MHPTRSCQTDFAGFDVARSRWARLAGFGIWSASEAISSYPSPCLVKRSWAMLRSNPTRDNQARAGE